jgi:peroxiredoxin
MQEKHQLQFKVLSDVGRTVADLYKLTYPLQKELVEAHHSIGIVLSDYYGEDAWHLPIPATYIISPEGKIAYAFADPDYTKRAEPTEVIARLLKL